MARTALIVFALLISACATSTWTPQTVVTLHDVDPELAETEGADLRYRAVEAPACDGQRRCRDVVSTAQFRTYTWKPLCDGRYCDLEQLELTDVLRESAEVAFTTEQMLAARAILRDGNADGADRERLVAFVRDSLQTVGPRITAARQLLEDRGAGVANSESVAEAQANLSRAQAHLDELLQPHRRGWKTAAVSN